MTLEQIEAILADVERMTSGKDSITDTDRHNRLEACRAGYSPYDSNQERQSMSTPSFVALCQLARERLQAGTFQQGIEAAADYCESKGIGPSTPFAIRNLKPEQKP